LEGSKGIRVKVEGKNDHDEGVTTSPKKDEVQEKSETESSKESKSLSQSLTCPFAISTKVC